MKRILIGFFALAFLLAGCAGLQKSRELTPEILGMSPVTLTCEVGEVSALCEIRLTDEGAEIKTVIEMICLVLGSETCQLVPAREDPGA